MLVVMRQCVVCQPTENKDLAVYLLLKSFNMDGELPDNDSDLAGQVWI